MAARMVKTVSVLRRVVLSGEVKTAVPRETKTPPLDLIHGFSVRLRNRASLRTD
jgi:hypothetical protein